MTTNTTPNHVELIDDVATLVITAPTVFTRSEQTARYDGRVEVAPGAYPYLPMLIGGQPCSIADAYWFVVTMPGLLVGGGYPDQTPGETRTTVGLQVYGYLVRESLGAAE